MADTFSEAKEHDRHNEDNFYNLGDIVELRQPKGILGCIKYIGPKLNKNGELISSDIHYVIQLEEYVGNGNGSWDGYQYIAYLRPDKTMHICKYSHIRCKRTSDDILKALYNILRANNKLKKQIKQQQNYINELEDINYKFEQHLESQTYYLIPKTNYKFQSSLPNLPLQSIPATSTTNLNTQTPHQLEFNNNIGSNNINININNIPSPESSQSTESIEISDKVKSEKWVGLPKQNIITPPPMNINNINNNNIKHNKFNNSLTLDILQQKTRRSHRRNQSKDFEVHNVNGNNNNNIIRHRQHRSNTFADDGHDGININQINEITPAPYTPPLPPVTASNISMDNSSEYNVNIKQKKIDIKYGKIGNNTHGKLQLYQREIEKQKSMDKMKNKKVVQTKVNMFEKLNQENIIQSNHSNDRNSIINESDSIQKIENQNHDQIENDIGNYDDSTFVIHTDQLIT